MTQAQGSEARLVIAEELAFKSVPELLLEDCEDAWNEQVVTGVTSEVDTDKKAGTNAVKFTMAANATTGILASEVIAIASLAIYDHITAWVKSSIALSPGDLQLVLDEHVLCASPLEAINIPALVADTYTPISLTLANPATDLLLISIGIKQVVDKGAFTFHIDDIRAIKGGLYVPFLNESLRMSRAFSSSNVIRSTRNPNKPTRGNQEVAGDIKVELNPWMGRLFKHTLGGYVRTGADSPYTHTFKIGSLPVGLQVEKQFPDIVQYLRYNGCKVNSHDFDVKTEGPITGGFTLMGAKETAAVLPHDGAPTDFGHNPFDGFEAVINQNTTPLAVVTEITGKIENNLDGSTFVIGGAGERYAVNAGKVKVSGKLTALFEDMTLYTLALNNTENSLQVVLTKGTGAGTAGNEKLTYNFDEVVFRPQAPVIAGDKGILVDLEFEAYYDNDSDASALWIELMNAQANL
jgi:hypothetical protein